MYLFNENIVKILPLTSKNSTAILAYSFSSPGYDTHYELNCKCSQLNPRLETRTRKKKKKTHTHNALTVTF